MPPKNAKEMDVGESETGYGHLTWDLGNKAPVIEDSIFGTLTTRVRVYALTIGQTRVSQSTKGAWA